MKLLILSLLSGVLHAGTHAVPASNFGFYHDNGTFNSTTNHAIGFYSGTPRGELRDFFVFNLTGLAGKIVSAKLRAYNPSSGFASPQSSETFALFDVSTPISTLTALTGGTAAFADLGTGVQLGSVIVNGASNDTIVEVNLNSAGIAYLNSANGNVAIGGALTTLVFGTQSERLFNNGAGVMVRELVVVTDDSIVPCAWTLAQANANVPADGGNITVPLTNSAGTNCSWSLTNLPAWLTAGILNGTGSAMIPLTALANPSPSPRSAVLTVAGLSLTVTQPGMTSSPGTAPLRYVNVPPCRLIETRPEYNFQGRVGPFGPPFVTAGETRTFVPSASTVCTVPTSARAFVFNVTLVPRGSGVDFATLYPGGDPRPDFWTVRSPDGLVVANSAIVRAGVGGGVSMYVSNGTDILVDIAGYFTDNAAESNLVYYPLTPCRVIDTRIAYRPQPGPFGPGSLVAQQARTVRFPLSPICQIPQGAAAYSVTLAVAPPAPLPFLTAWPAGGSQPNVSSINSPNGRVLANSVIVPASADGSVSFSAFATTDLIVDINGYFAPDNGSTGLYYYPVTQCRISQSNDASFTGSFGGPAFADATSRSIPVPASSRCPGIPASAKAYAINATVIPGGNPMPFLTVWPSGQPQPNASVINAFEGQTVSSAFIVPAGANGSVDVYAFRQTHVVLEISGYFGR